MFSNICGVQSIQWSCKCFLLLLVNTCWPNVDQFIALNINDAIWWRGWREQTIEKIDFFKIGPKARDPRFAGLPPCTRYTFSYIPSVFRRNVLQYFCIRRRRSMKYEYEWKHQHSLPKCRIYKGSLIIHWRFFRNRGQCTIHMTSSAATLKAKSIRLIQTCMLTG